MNKGKRLIPEDLLDYVQDLNNNHPDPSAEWGGSSYTAGTGIDISEGEISIDNTVATKTDLEDYELKSEAFSGDYDDLTNKPTIPTDTSDLTNGAGFITGIDSSMVTTALGYTPGTSNFSGNYNDLSNKPDLSIYAQSSNLATVATSGSYTDLSNKPTIPTVTSSITQGSTDAVTSGAVYNAIGDIESLLAAI